MNGLDKIIAQILDDAKQESLAIQEKAAGEAETTLAAAGEKVKKLEEEQAKSAAQREKSYEERLRSSAALKKRQAILAAKQAIIEEMLAAAHRELLAKPDEAYFAWMEQLLSRFVTDRAGEIYVSKRDLERMPDDFPAKIEKAAQERMEILMDGLLTTYPAPDKEVDQIKWTAHMNMLREMAEETILTELVYS